MGKEVVCFWVLGLGAEQVVSIWAADIVEAGAAAIYVDNSGFVWASRNGCTVVVMNIFIWGSQ